MGINRGPAGVMAYLLLHTSVPTLAHAQRAVRKIRKKAAITRNTFVRELEMICLAAGKPLA